LYTETLLAHDSNATKQFKTDLFASPEILGLVLGIAPVDFHSGFTTRSNFHELLIYTSLRKNNVPTAQFHQVTTWKAQFPFQGKAPNIREASLLPVFHPQQLGTFLHDFYHGLFEQEDAMTFWDKNKKNMQRAIAKANLLHYNRQSFVLFLKSVRRNLKIPQGLWDEVMERFLCLRNEDKSMPMDSNNCNDFWAHLHSEGLYTVPQIRTSSTPIGRFHGWKAIPPVVRIMLLVPRQNFISIVSLMKDTMTPPLHCDVRGTWSHNIFSSVHVAFGKVISVGTISEPRVSFEEDPVGWNGNSSLVASFIMPSGLLCDIEPMTNLKVCLSVKSTSSATTVVLIQKLGPHMNLFGADLMDTSLVHVLPEDGSHFAIAKTCDVPLGNDGTIGEAGPSTVELDDECELPQCLTCRIDLSRDDVKDTFSSREKPIPTIIQVSPWALRVKLKEFAQDVPFPAPIIGDSYKLRLARKQYYIEVSSMSFSSMAS
jgi:hypothetical protein